MEKKEMYVAPEVEILEVAVERGFQASQGGSQEGYDPDKPIEW